MRLENKVCLITGAGSGMGRTASLLFAREGAKVVVAEVNAGAAEETLGQVRAAGGEAITAVTDVTRADDCRAMVEAALLAYGRIDVLYNNAGIFLEADHSVTDTPLEVWERVQSVNVRGVYLCSKFAIPAMIDGGGGSIVNVASFVALVGCSVPQDAYTASKGAVIALTKSLAVQFGPKGVRANAICPGPIETPLMTSWLLTNPEAKAVRLARIPMGRFGRSEDVVNLALYLASDESTWTNGSVMVVDGGITSNYF